MKTIKLLILMLVLMLLLWLPCADARKITVLTDEWYPYVSKDLINFGFAAEVVFYAFLMSGIETEIVFVSRDEAEEQVKKGIVFAAFPHKRTEDRKQFAYFSEPIARSKEVFFYMRGKLKDFQYRNLDDLKKYKLGGIKGYYYVSILNKAGIAIDFASNASISFRKLYVGLVDLVPENEFVGWGLIQKYFPDEMYKFTAAENALSEDTLHLMVSKKFPQSSDLLKQFNNGLNQIHQKGVFKDLVRKYMQKIKINMPSTPY